MIKSKMTEKQLLKTARLVIGEGGRSRTLVDVGCEPDRQLMPDIGGLASVIQGLMALGYPVQVRRIKRDGKVIFNKPVSNAQVSEQLRAAGLIDAELIDTERVEIKLTVEELIEKFDLEKPNENCLTDVACPRCGGRDHFKIVVSTMMEMSDEGSGYHEDVDWNRMSHTKCCNQDKDGNSCDHEGPHHEFVFEGLDEAIEGEDGEVTYDDN